MLNDLLKRFGRKHEGGDDLPEAEGVAPDGGAAFTGSVVEQKKGISPRTAILLTAVTALALAGYYAVDSGMYAEKTKPVTSGSSTPYQSPAAGGAGNQAPGSPVTTSASGAPSVSVANAAASPQAPKQDTLRAKEPVQQAASAEGRKLYLPAADILGSASAKEQDFRTKKGALKEELEVVQLETNIEKVRKESQIHSEESVGKLEALKEKRGTGKKAKIEVVIPPPQLVSVLSAKGAKMAVLMMSDGSTQRLREGESISGFTVVEINDNTAQVRDPKGKIVPISLHLPDRYPVANSMFAAKGGQQNQPQSAGQQYLMRPQSGPHPGQPSVQGGGIGMPFTPPGVR